MASRDTMTGTTIKHYEIGDKLGEGGMGAVYRARDTRLDRPVAFKVLKPELVARADARARFLREARSAAATTHAAIAQIYDVDEQDGTIFIAMEFVEGRTLRSLIKEKALDLQRSIEIATQVSEGLAKAHAKGIVHRDIKSDNIMVTPDGQAKILDFGLAKALHPTDGAAGANDSAAARTIADTTAQTQLGVVMGTIAYMSPEQARGRGVDHATDLFSLGIVIYEMVTGELPFKGESPLDTMHAIAFDEVPAVTRIRTTLPPDLHRIVSRCLRKQPADRYANATALADDLRRLKRDLDSGVQRALPANERVRRGLDWVRDTLPTAPTGLVVAALVVGALVWVIVAVNNVGGMLGLAVVGLLLFRWVRNRRRRQLKRFVRRMRSLPDVRAILARETRITVIVDRAQARVYVRVNNAMEKLNAKLFHGDPFESAVRDDMTEEELVAALREPGVVYVRKDVLSG